ncbi:MAG: TIGR00266 family protein [Clostridiales bacterium 38-18]|nr:MAG: TIGR00266 family protein [Clostridiales bacterium 38-18]
MRAHEIDFEVFGDDLQFVEIELDPRESVVAEAGAMMYMENGIDMDTIFGDGSEGSGGGGFMGKLASAGKRMITGESLFMTQFTNQASDRKKVAFAAPYPGKIVPVDLAAYGGKIIAQKDAYLCSAKGISVGIEFQRKIGVGFFGGEGFIMQKLEGDGLAFLHAGGTIIEKELAAGELLRLDTGCLVALTGSVSYNIEMVKGIKSAVFGGEGLFLATLKGPGRVWLQSLPFSRMADRILSSARAHGGKSTGEGSLLGGLGNLLDGK